MTVPMAVNIAARGPLNWKSLANAEALSDQETIFVRTATTSDGLERRSLFTTNLGESGWSRSRIVVNISKSVSFVGKLPRSPKYAWLIQSLPVNMISLA
jgi:hypothetical protein